MLIIVYGRWLYQSHGRVRNATVVGSNPSWSICLFSFHLLYFLPCTAKEAQTSGIRNLDVPLWFKFSLCARTSVTLQFFFIPRFHWMRLCFLLCNTLEIFQWRPAEVSRFDSACSSKIPKTLTSDDSMAYRANHFCQLSSRSTLDESSLSKRRAACSLKTLFVLIYRDSITICMAMKATSKSFSRWTANDVFCHKSVISCKSAALQWHTLYLKLSQTVSSFSDPKRSAGGVKKAITTDSSPCISNNPYLNGEPLWEMPEKWGTIYSATL